MTALMIRDSGVRSVSLFPFYGTHEQLKSSGFIISFLSFVWIWIPAIVFVGMAFDAFHATHFNAVHFSSLHSMNFLYRTTFTNEAF